MTSEKAPEKTPEPSQQEASHSVRKVESTGSDTPTEASEKEFEELLKSMDDAQADTILRLLRIC